jgi:hypothetical protein
VGGRGRGRMGSERRTGVLVWFERAVFGSLGVSVNFE